MTPRTALAVALGIGVVAAVFAWPRVLPGEKPQDAAVAEALRQVGKPYRWGAMGPDAFDCSGLMWYAWRGTSAKFKRTTAHGLYKLTRPIPVDRMARGDMVFFGKPESIHHVGIYIGNGLMVHAPNGGKTVRVSKVASLQDPYSGGRMT